MIFYNLSYLNLEDNEISNSQKEDIQILIQYQEKDQQRQKRQTQQNQAQFEQREVRQEKNIKQQQKVEKQQKNLVLNLTKNNLTQECRLRIKQFSKTKNNEIQNKKFIIYVDICFNNKESSSNCTQIYSDTISDDTKQNQHQNTENFDRFKSTLNPQSTTSSEDGAFLIKNQNQTQKQDQILQTEGDITNDNSQTFQNIQQRISGSDSYDSYCKQTSFEDENLTQDRQQKQNLIMLLVQIANQTNNFQAFQKFHLLYHQIEIFTCFFNNQHRKLRFKELFKNISKNKAKSQYDKQQLLKYNYLNKDQCKFEKYSQNSNYAALKNKSNFSKLSCKSLYDVRDQSFQRELSRSISLFLIKVQFQKNQTITFFRQLFQQYFRANPSEVLKAIKQLETKEQKQSFKNQKRQIFQQLRSSMSLSYQTKFILFEFSSLKRIYVQINEMVRQKCFDKIQRRQKFFMEMIENLFKKLCFYNFVMSSSASFYVTKSLIKSYLESKKKYKLHQMSETKIKIAFFWETYDNSLILKRLFQDSFNQDCKTLFMVKNQQHLYKAFVFESIFFDRIQFNLKNAKKAKFYAKYMIHLLQYSNQVIFQLSNTHSANLQAASKGVKDILIYLICKSSQIIINNVENYVLKLKNQQFFNLSLKIRNLNDKWINQNQKCFSHMKKSLKQIELCPSRILKNQAQEKNAKISETESLHLNDQKLLKFLNSLKQHQKNNFRNSKFQELKNMLDYIFCFISTYYLSQQVLNKIFRRTLKSIFNQSIGIRTFLCKRPIDIRFIQNIEQKAKIAEKDFKIAILESLKIYSMLFTLLFYGQKTEQNFQQFKSNLKAQRKQPKEFQQLLSSLHLLFLYNGEKLNRQFLTKKSLNQVNQILKEYIRYANLISQHYQERIINQEAYLNQPNLDKKHKFAMCMFTKMQINEIICIGGNLLLNNQKKQTQRKGLYKMITSRKYLKKISSFNSDLYLAQMKRKCKFKQNK